MSPATPGRAPGGSAPRALTTDTLRIREVWAENLDEEMLLIRDLVDQYNHLAMDTEFPGVVARPVGTFKTPGEYQYQTLRCNVDMLKIIQLGLTFSDAEGNLPVVDGCFSAWQFNFREFDVAADMYAADSIELLRHSGIDFAAHAARGIDTRRFGEALLVSGVVLIPDVRWITFHSGYDFGYLLKLVTCLPLPATEAEFFEVLGLYFPIIYDMKYLMKFCDSLHGGLQKLAEVLDVERIGPQHQAGSDALLTSRTFFRLREVYFKAPPPPAGSAKAADPNGALERYVNVLYGLGVDGQAATGDDTAAAAD